LFCSAQRFALHMDDARDPGREVVSYVPRKTEALKAWEAIAARPLPHVKFKEAIEDRAGDIDAKSAGLLMAVARFSLRTEVAYNADLEDGKSIGFVVTEKQGSATAKMPRAFTVQIPIFQGWPKLYPVEFRVAFEADGDKVKFQVEARNLQDVYDVVLLEMASHAQTALGSEWLVVRGTPKTAA